MSRKETYVRRCVVFYANPYSIVDEKTGEVNEGISTSYINSFDISPYVSEDGSLGIPFNKQSVSTQLLPKFVCVPGVYDITFEMVTQSGKSLLKPIDLNFLSKVSFVEVAPDGKKESK